MQRTLKFVEDCYYNEQLIYTANSTVTIDDSEYPLRWVIQGKAELLDTLPLESEKIVNESQIDENKKSKKPKIKGK
jgi:hypothetical protein